MANCRNTTQFTVVLKNEPGQLRRLCLALAREQISILGLSAETIGDVGLVRFITDKTLDVRTVLEDLGLTPVQRQVFCVPIFNRVGELARVTKLLEDAGINIETLYGTAESGETCRLVLAVDKPERAEKLLGALADNLVVTGLR